MVYPEYDDNGEDNDGDDEDGISETWQNGGMDLEDDEIPSYIPSAYLQEGVPTT